MEMELRTATPAERLYIAEQSTQIAGQTGYVGNLRADMGADGRGFFKTWQDHWRDLATEEFQCEFEDFLDALVGDTQYGGFLKSLDNMEIFCHDHPESDFGDGRTFGFRADTAQYSHLIRLTPQKGEDNLRIYCYRRDWLTRHMKHAEKGIRFIAPDYKEKFRIPDGDMVRISKDSGETRDRVARYIDDCHVEIGNDLYHICEFAERLERSGSTVIPLRSSLPEQCYGILPNSGAVVILKRGETGYYQTSISLSSKEEAKAIADEYNRKLGVTKAQAAAMCAGSMFGWACPAADPKSYDENGVPIEPRQKDRGDAR